MWAFPLINGRAGEIRTHDLLHPMNGGEGLGALYLLGVAWGSVWVGSAYAVNMGADLGVEEDA